MTLNPTMDYGSLLQLAKKTSDQKKEAKRSFPSLGPVRTSAEQKNAELEKKKLLDANVARFLAKRQEEERKKRVEANVKREGLLAIRNQDSKARKRVKIMNKSAKSADKSAIEDAVGPSDYYVIEEPLCFMSQESLAQEEKFLEKLCKVPEEEKFAKAKKNLNKDLSGTKDRVKLALQLGDSLDKKERTRETKDKTKDHHKDKSKDSNYRSEREEPVVEEMPKKPRQPRPPPMNYLELLKLAEKMQQEPVQEAPKEKEPETRPMTTKERELYLLEEASRKRKEEGWKVDQRPMKLNKVTNSLQSQGSKASVSSNNGERSFASTIPRIPKVKDRPSNLDQRVESPDDRPQKSSRDEKYGSSTEKRSVNMGNIPSRPTSKQSSRPLENSNRPKQNSNLQRNSIEPGPKENTEKTVKEEKRLMKNESEKSRQKGHEKEMPGSSRFSSQQHGNPSQIQHDRKERASSSSKNLKPNLPQPISLKPSDGQQNFRKLPSSDKAKNLGSLDVKPKSQDRSTDLKNSRQKDLQPPTLKSKTSTDPKSRPTSSFSSKPKQNLPNVLSRSLPVSNSKPKQHPADIKSKPFPPSGSKLQPSMDSKSRTVHPTDSKSRQLPSTNKSKQLPPSNIKPRNIPSSEVKTRNFPPSDLKPKTFSTSEPKPRNFPSSDAKSRNFPPSDVKSRNSASSDVKPRNCPPSDVKPRNFPPPDVRPRSFPPADVMPRSFPPSDVKRKQFPPADVRRGPKALAKKRRVIDSDEEYDSEDVNFIDDGPDDGEDYSKHIREIFGYDRNKYRGVEDDDECMESSFSQQMKEEFKSTKQGILEDLEDIRREKQREAILKKKRKLK